MGKLTAQAKIQMQSGGVKFACHIDCPPETPDGCVLDYGAPGDCAQGHYRDGRERKARETCPHWLPLSGEAHHG